MVENVNVIYRGCRDWYWANLATNPWHLINYIIDGGKIRLGCVYKNMIGYIQGQDMPSNLGGVGEVSCKHSMGGWGPYVLILHFQNVLITTVQ